MKDILFFITGFFAIGPVIGLLGWLFLLVWTTRPVIILILGSVLVWVICVASFFHLLMKG